MRRLSIHFVLGRQLNCHGPWELGQLAGTAAGDTLGLTFPGFVLAREGCPIHLC